MNIGGLTDSLATLACPPNECPSCHTASRVGHELCLACLLQAAMKEEDSADSESLDAVLAGIEIPDTHWRLGNYEILEEIGRGGMGVIYRARQRHSRRIVAVKRILSYHADSHGTLARFRREAEAAASLDHPNILPIYEVAESEEGVPFFSMKFAPGGSLAEIGPALREEPRRIVALMAKVTRAVQYAHGQGILHRDLKPGNILLDGRGEPLVSDFGLAKWLDTTSDLTRTLTIFGTPGYIAPEQAEGPAAGLKPTADIYSLGAILFDLLTGRPPFLGEHALAVIRQASEKPAPKLRSLVRSVDRDLETICARCLDREPAARYRSAADLAQDLERWLEGRPIIARPVLPPVKLWRWSKRNPVLAGAATACLIFGLAAGVALTRSSRLKASLRAGQIASHSIAVAPFEDLDELTTTSSQARAVTLSLLSGLARDKALHTTAVVERFPERTDFWKAEDWRKIGDALGVRFVIAGTVRHRGSKQRIVLRVIDAGTSEVAAKRLCEIDAAKESTETFIKQLVILLESLCNRMKSVADNAQPISANQETIEYVRAGQEYFFRYTPENTTIALGYFEKAIAADPACAKAQAMYSLACLSHAMQSPDASSDRWVTRADKAAAVATKLDPELALAHRAQGDAQAYHGYFREAQENSLEAIELDPSDLHPAGFVAYSLRMCGRPDLAIGWFRRSETRGQRPGLNAAAIGDSFCDLIDDESAERAYAQSSEFCPDIPDGKVGEAREKMLHRNFNTARKEAREALTSFPTHPYPMQMLAQIEFFNRNFNEAATLYQQLVAKDRGGGASFYGSIGHLSGLGESLCHIGRQAEGEVLLRENLVLEEKAIKTAPENRETLYDLTATYAAMGEREMALDYLKRAIAAGWLDYRSLAMDPRFEDCRDDPRFQQTLQELTTRVASLRRQRPVVLAATKQKN